ncbi:GTP-binding protein [Candidatus Parcubacteria bacterium]|nr:MAG: GTP-binding protein [Candidatus Parcubacteria bacterium]
MGNKNLQKQEESRDSAESGSIYPPVVSVLGHVDAGKTTLLDAIRKTQTTAREAGGITQKIGASEVEVDHDKNKRKITFIDTPGHQAFANMRSQGVNAADIVLLIVSLVDGVQPQTKESIKTIKESETPYIVVFTKNDLPTANIEKAKQQLLNEEVLLEGLGGEIPYISVSAKNGEGIEALLDLILLVYDLSGIKKDAQKDFLGIVIDSKLDKRRGVAVSIVIKQGRLVVGDKLYDSEKEVGKVRATVNPQSKNVKEALPGDAVEILGITKVLPLGTLLHKKPEQVLIQSQQPQPSQRAIIKPQDFLSFLRDEKKQELLIVLKTESYGEYEAIKNSLPEDVEIVFYGQGDISVSDIILAKDFKALAIGFNVKITDEARDLAKNEDVFHKTYNIIYELLDEIKDALAGLTEAVEEKIQGKANIVAVFEGTQEKIMGLKVTEGKMIVGAKVKIYREEKLVGESRIVTLKRAKESVKEVSKGNECGATISPFIDFQVDDVILSHRKD